MQSIKFRLFDVRRFDAQLNAHGHGTIGTKMKRPTGACRARMERVQLAEACGWRCLVASPLHQGEYTSFVEAGAASYTYTCMKACASGSSGGSYMYRLRVLRQHRFKQQRTDTDQRRGVIRKSCTHASVRMYLSVVRPFARSDEMNGGRHLTEQSKFGSIRSPSNTCSSTINAKKDLLLVLFDLNTCLSTSTSACAYACILHTESPPSLHGVLPAPTVPCPSHGIVQHWLARMIRAHTRLACQEAFFFRLHPSLCRCVLCCTHAAWCSVLQCGAHLSRQLIFSARVAT